MTDDAHKLAARCAATTAAASAGLDWVADPRSARAISGASLAAPLRRAAAEAGRLARTAGRPNCVGVFGPSQAGKSYLISILARRGAEPLVATFAGDQPEVDFLRDINPVGGEESTGVVTRFTVHGAATPAGFPVALRLLTQTDVVKILVNSFFRDGDQEYEEAPEPAAVERLLAGLEARREPAPVDTLTEAEMWDVADYVRQNAGGAAAAGAVEPFWPRIAALVPRLRVPERAELLSVLWGGHATYTALYQRLAAALASLGFAEDAYCALPALVPSNTSVVNVNSLEGLGDDAAPRVTVAIPAGGTVALARPVLTALIAEMRIVFRDRPQPFFEHTDLLDFPGYRSRFSADLKRLFRDNPKAASGVFLRGKVDYLFQRYTADLELTAMVLCVPDSNLEVTSLPKAVEGWVAATHGATPERRARRPTLLFFAMTKFDRTLERKGGADEGDLAEKFDVRFRASLGPFARVESSWVRQWRPGEAFRNLFLVRNPNVQFMGVVDYAGGRETGIVPAQAPRLASLRSAFTGLPAARLHLADPGAAWDALMALNDGGAGRLAAALGAACTPDLKLGQVAARLDSIRADAAGLLAPYHTSDDAGERRVERLAVVDQAVFPDLEEAAMRGTFGTALRGLMIDAADLHAALVEALNRPDVAVGATPLPRAGGLFKRSTAAPPAPPRADRPARLAGAALAAWAGHMQASADDEAFARRAGLSKRSLREIVAELGAAAQRTGLADRIASELRARAAASEQNEAVARRAGLVAERALNRFVAELGFDRLGPADQAAQFGADLEEPVFAPRPVRNDAAGLGATEPDFVADFVRQWGYALRATASANALARGGSIEDAQSNARLGAILQDLRG